VYLYESIIGCFRSVEGNFDQVQKVSDLKDQLCFSQWFLGGRVWFAKLFSADNGAVGLKTGCCVNWAEVCSCIGSALSPTRALTCKRYQNVIFEMRVSVLRLQAVQLFKLVWIGWRFTTPASFEKAVVPDIGKQEESSAHSFFHDTLS